ncbi:MAG: hypothetical protein LBK00_03160 [Treponema sp.]|jgi:hypothetical protein|nr:hypothetical protein [Treponema sp.]
MAKKVIAFCKSKNIKYHIKKVQLLKKQKYNVFFFQENFQGLLRLTFRLYMAFLQGCKNVGEVNRGKESAGRLT